MPRPLFIPLLIAPLIFFCSRADASTRLWFTKNEGQWPSHIESKLDLDGGAIFVERDQWLFHLYDKDALRSGHLRLNVPDTIRRHAFRLKFPGCNKNAAYAFQQAASFYKNYYTSSSRSAWKSHVASYGWMSRTMLWEGVSASWETHASGIKTTFYADDPANASQIKLQWDGLSRIYLQDGKLHLETAFGTLIEDAPVAWQTIGSKQVKVSCKWKLMGNTASFELGKARPDLPVIIDPLLIFASYSGSTSDNFGFTASYDSDGHLYAGGIAFSAGYPVTLGVFDESYNGIVQSGITDAVISKFSSDGTNLLYSTYLGGATGTEVVNSLVVNNNNELYAFGITGSTDFPVTLNAFDQSFNGGIAVSFPGNGTEFQIGTDLFVSGFNSDGSALLGSTLIGGTANDGLNDGALNYNYADYFRGEINLDAAGNILVATCSYSVDFPLVNALQSTAAGGLDGVLFKFNPALSTLLSSTYFGGAGDDAFYAVTTDDQFHVYCTGGSSSGALNFGNSAFQQLNAGGSADGILIHLDSTMSTLVGGSFIGTSFYDQCFMIQLDNANHIYVFGQTEDPAFPISPGTYSNPGSGQFLAKFSNNLNQLLISTVFGNSVPGEQPSISPTAFLVDVCNNVYISGWARFLLAVQPVTNLPVTAGAIQTNTDGYDFYLAVFGPDFQNLLYGTYFGGSTSREHVDGGTSRFDRSGIIYQCVCAGCNSQDDFPVTPGVWSSINGSTNCNIGVFKLDMETSITTGDFSVNPPQGCAPLTIAINGSGSANASFLYDFSGLGTAFQEDTTFTFSQPGVYTITLIVTDSLSCNFSDTIIHIVQVFEPEVASFTSSNASCSSDYLFNASNPNNLITSFSWNFGSGWLAGIQNQPHSFSSPGNYTVSLAITDQNGCRDTSSLNLNVTAFSAQGSADPLCEANAVSFTLLTTGITQWQWNFNDPQNPNASSVLSNPVYTYGAPGNYTTDLIIFFGTNNTCSDTLSIPVNPVPPLSMNALYNQNGCSNNFSFVDLSSHGADPVIQRSWTFSDGFTSGDSTFQRSLNPGPYTFTLIATTLDGCQDTLQVSFFVEPVNLSPPSDVTLCKADTIQLQAGPADLYTWSPSSILLNPQGQSSATIYADEDLALDLELAVILQNGDTCSASFSINVNVIIPGSTQAALSASEDTIVQGDLLTLTASSYKPGILTWLIPGEYITLNDSMVQLNVTQSAVYAAVINYDGICTDTLKTRVVVLRSICRDGQAFVPNTFSPNQDGANDLFFPEGYMPAYYLSVYDRWGQVVYEAANGRWDGTRKGTDADAGVFAYLITVCCPDNKGVLPEQCSHDKNEHAEIIKGNVTLIR